jgi:para-aminobenzoate synthetase/4-amino-4-deoxychorismate lyase
MSTTGIRIPLDSDLPPEQAVLLLRGHTHPFALIGEWAGGALLGSAPTRVAHPHEDPFELLSRSPAVAPGGEAVVGGGWVGWLGYTLAQRLERLPPEPPGADPRAPFSLGWYDHVVRHDGERWWFEALWTSERADALDERRAWWQEALTQSPEPRAAAVARPFAPVAPAPGAHLIAVADCIERIAAGEIFQANLSLRLESHFDGELVDLAAPALAAARPRFGALVGGVLSLSPERFLRRDGRTVWTEPIKGTRPRTGAAADDAASRRALLASAKDAAEHVMIVDLMRNDLGRVCSYGTIERDEPRVEAHPGVWHLVSTVSGTLRDGVTDADLLRATFPPGSVTGAPKIQAMRVISELEPRARHAFTGAIGIASPIAGLDLNVTIRTFETDGDRIWIDVGGGVVADSTPDSELAEAFDKARGPVAALGARLSEGVATRGPTGDLPRALAFGRRPDPARGLLETILGEGGQARDLDRHLARLRASARFALGSDVQAELAGLVADAVAPHAGRVRVRIALTPDGCGVAAGPEGPPPGAPVLLRPVLLPGGLGEHKWVDRDLVKALQAAFPGEVPLLVDADGSVLEASYANVWIVEDDRWLTPPADGRILPGVTRDRMLATQPGAAEAVLTLERLAAASRIVLTSSIRGVHEALIAPPLAVPPPPRARPSARRPCPAPGRGADPRPSTGSAPPAR